MQLAGLIPAALRDRGLARARDLARKGYVDSDSLDLTAPAAGAEVWATEVEVAGRCPGATSVKVSVGDSPPRAAQVGDDGAFHVTVPLPVGEVDLRVEARGPGRADRARRCCRVRSDLFTDVLAPRRAHRRPVRAQENPLALPLG